ncbi:hypothetical protein PF008_g31315 [Phytophthora fragariae]|uniref:Uncharacterized protein n=1 Tax=Phytophthora fragariae TaxID=53985 RepID=A0A6G0Q305_9STRA|nr:hypothetical protein PF008_g31315 [Phytophthora fragariae]
MLGNCDGPVSVYEVPLAPVHQVLPLPLLAVLFAQLGHYHDPQSADSARYHRRHRCSSSAESSLRPGLSQ